METLFIGKNILFLPEIGSTNSYAIDLLKNVNLSEGTMVHTANQTQGKGMRGSTWVAEPASNLTVSIILKPGFLSLQKQFYLYLITALACYDTTSEFLQHGQFDIKIKWPNDILVDQKKIAGILIENNLLQNVIKWSVVGIGININQKKFDGFSAISLYSLLGEKTDNEKVLGTLCGAFEKYYLDLKNKRFEYLRELYISRLFALNSVRDFTIKGKIQSFCVKGIGETGLLILENDQQKKIEVDVKEVAWNL